MQTAKKIGILTFPTSINYGAFMQTFALSSKLKKIPNVEVEVIYYEMPIIQKRYKKHANSLHNLSDDILAPIKLNKMIKIFQNELSKISLSRDKTISDDYLPLFEKIKNKYDIIIVGSDAVWNWNLRGFPNAFFLNENLNTRKFSYAASSHGLDHSMINDSQLEYLKIALNDFEFLGIRDSATEELIKKIDPTLMPIHTCDPTVFLNLEELQVNFDNLENKLKKHGIDLNKPIIGLMGNNEMGKMLRLLYGNDYQIVALYNPNRYADCFLWDITPFEWARVFKYFKITFTQFFHGTLLSLKNGTPTISIDYWTAYASKHESKMKDFLRRLDLLDRYFLSSNLDNKQLEEIKIKSDALILEQDSDKLFEGLGKEAASYSNFQSALEKVF